MLYCLSAKYRTDLASVVSKAAPLPAAQLPGYSGQYLVIVESAFQWSPLTPDAVAEACFTPTLLVKRNMNSFFASARAKVTANVALHNWGMTCVPWVPWPPPPPPTAYPRHSISCGRDGVPSASCLGTDIQQQVRDTARDTVPAALRVQEDSLDEADALFDAPLPHNWARIQPQTADYQRQCGRAFIH